ncbi:MAG: hypothetical protein KC619_18695 [Myxococcales bacterium]|nr:hypothetical protein [Myxococcales bacterium]
MGRRELAWTGFALGVAALIGLYVWLSREPEPEPVDTVALEAERQEEAREREEQWNAIGAESRELIPPAFEGLQLGMRRDRVQELRPQMRPNPQTMTNDDAPGLVFLEEDLPNGARAIFGFETESQRLQRMQVLSLLPSSDAIGPHLAAMNETYGAPTGIWQCPNTGGVPTRRFTWRHGRTTVMDIFLVYGGRVSVTLYIAPSGVAYASLMRAQCRPVQSREEAVEFPVTTPEQMRATEGQQ